MDVRDITRLNFDAKLQPIQKHIKVDGVADTQTDGQASEIRGQMWNGKGSRWGAYGRGKEIMQFHRGMGMVFHDGDLLCNPGLCYQLYRFWTRGDWKRFDRPYGLDHGRFTGFRGKRGC